MMVHCSTKGPAVQKRTKVSAGVINNNPGRVLVKVFHKSGVLVREFQRNELDMVMEMFKGSRFQIRIIN